MLLGLFFVNKKSVYTEQLTLIAFLLITKMGIYRDLVDIDDVIQMTSIFVVVLVVEPAIDHQTIVLNGYNRYRQI